MATWSSTGNFYQDFLDLGEENFALAAEQGQVTLELGFREVTLGKDLFSSLEVCEPVSMISDYEGPLLAIAGSVRGK